MKGLFTLLAVMVSVFAAAPVPAKAEGYSASRTASGAYVCPMTYGLGVFGDAFYARAQVTCGATHNLVSVTASCIATLYQGGAVSASGHGPRSQNCDAVTARPKAFVSHRAVSDVRIELNNEIWSAPANYFVSSQQDFHTSYSCRIGPERRVKTCTFDDRDW